jgi:hypothetical protein
MGAAGRDRVVREFNLSSGVVRLRSLFQARAVVTVAAEKAAAAVVR